MPSEKDYLALINDILTKQTLILGPDIVRLKAASVPGLVMGENGQVDKLEGNPQEILQKLVSEYVSLSGEIVKNILSPVFAQYPEIKVSLE